MPDAIVQTIKIEVDGADQAAAEIKKVGQATEEVQATAAKTAGGTQELGKGLDQVSQKSGVSSRELRALGKVMKEMGAGEIAGTAIGFARIAMVLGPVGVALFAVAEAVSFVRGKMKEAEEQTKALVETFANIAKISAEMHPERDGGWGATAAGMKEAANNAVLVADQYERIIKGQKEIISPLTTPATRTQALIMLLEAGSVKINDVMADVKKLGEESNKALIIFAQLAEKMSPIEKANLSKDLKGLGFTDEQIKSLEKGAVTLKKLQDDAKKPFFSPQQQKDIDNLGKGWDAFAAASKRAWALVAGDAETGTRGWAQTIAASIATGFAQAMAVVGQFLRDAVQAISQFVTTAPGNAWQWIKDTAVSVWEQVKTLAQQAYDAVVKFVTTAPANAWAWIKETWNANVPKALQIGTGGGGGGAEGAAPQSLAGGGLLGGRGTGTSDSNLAWVSRGEHIMPARAVSQPGVLALLEALRFSGGNLRGVLNSMGHFALGGMVAPRLSIPAFAGSGMHNVTIAFPGLPEITGLRASSGVVDQLRNAAAMAQVRSGGRKPSRYS